LHATSDPDGYFGERAAATYDESTAAMSTPEVIDPILDFLVPLAGGDAALEFGIGTGRIAIPLAARGIEVHGIELSRAMAAKITEKPGGRDIRVAIGDFATTKAEGTFGLVYLVFNTIMNLTTQEAQVACFENAASHLEPGGSFVIEVVVPGLQRLAPGQVIQDFHVSDTWWGVDEYDVVTQGVKSHQFKFEDGEVVRHNAVPFRYVWPAELDLMARLSGMRLRERWSGWKREPLTAESRQHISVWQKISPPAG
jgi:cyclopropane fatty-acyl-phospholipid synthase-like methyltransferase